MLRIPSAPVVLTDISMVVPRKFAAFDQKDFETHGKGGHQHKKDSQNDCFYHGLFLNPVQI